MTDEQPDGGLQPITVIMPSGAHFEYMPSAEYTDYLTVYRFALEKLLNDANIEPDEFAAKLRRRLPHGCFVAFDMSEF